MLDPYSDVFIKEYKIDYSKNKLLKLSFSNISKEEASLMKINIKLMVSAQQISAQRRIIKPKFSFSSNILSMELNYCPQELAEQFYKFMEFCKKK